MTDIEKLTVEDNIRSNLEKSQVDSFARKGIRLVAAATVLVASAGAWRGYERGIYQEEKFNNIELEQVELLTGCRSYISNSTQEDDQNLTVRLSELPTEAAEKCNFKDNAVTLFSDEWNVKQRAEDILPSDGGFEIGKVYADAEVVFPSVNTLNTRISELEKRSKDINYRSVALEVGLLSTASGIFTYGISALGFIIFASRKEKKLQTPS